MFDSRPAELSAVFIFLSIELVYVFDTECHILFMDSLVAYTLNGRWCQFCSHDHALCLHLLIFVVLF